VRRIIAWFAANGVAANLLMVLIAAGGLLTAFQLKQEVFPELSTETIIVTVPYPGAAPEEVEEGVVVRIEEAIQDLEGIDEIDSTAAENAATVTVSLLLGTDVQKLLNDVKSRVDAIDTFPEEAEEPIIQELTLRRQVINVAVHGAAGERTLKEIAEGVRDDLSALPGITQVELASARPYEISIEVSEGALRRYGLTFDRVAAAVRGASLDLPGGEIETEGGEILLRTEGQAYRGQEFAELPLVSLADGTRIAVGDVATVIDGFADTDQAARFNGEPAVQVLVFRVGDQNALDLAAAVRDYVAEAQPRLPEGITLTPWQDDSKVLRSRLDLLIRNGQVGFVLVFLVLALFLRLRLAAWVALGIPISFLGAIALMPTADVSINLISLFAFIVVLGIVVDDAIVVGENIYSRLEAGGHGVEAAVEGAHQVSMPVIFAVLTTIAAFAPLLNVPGTTGRIMRVIPIIVIATLVFSLIESLLVLPNHLSHLHPGSDRQPGPVRARWQALRRGFADRLERFVRRAYRPSLEWALAWRYFTVAAALAMLLVAFAVVRGGWLRFTFFPPVEADNVVAILEMPQGTPAEITARAVARIEETAFALQQELERDEGPGLFRNLSATIGEQPYRTAQSRGGGNLGRTFSGGYLGEVNIELRSAEERDVTSPEIADLWRQRTGAVADAVELTFTASLFDSGEPINVQLSGGSMDRLREVAARLEEELATYPGVREIADSYRAGKREIELDITPEAEAAGLSLADLGRQVRQGFYGEEAQRIQRGRDDVKVMVRYPEADRRSLAGLESMRLRLPDGTAVPFAVAARAGYSRGPASIRRTDRQRVLNVTADVDTETANANRILADLEAEVLPRVLRDYPAVRYSLEGEQQEQRQTLGGLARGFALALLVIYGLLAIPFRSYLQPLIVMSAIPFGFIGAIGGHLLMGLDLTILSGFGIVALTGVVVNDSLVMVDWINGHYRGGMPLAEAIREAGMARFRPILLTSLTTFAGLSPLLLEQSVQAQFLIPMAVSLAFGVLFATLITLILVPVLYFLLEEGKAALARTFGRDAELPTSRVEAASLEPPSHRSERLNAKKRPRPRAPR